jgi:hypothetical protein
MVDERDGRLAAGRPPAASPFIRDDDGTLPLASAIRQALGAASVCWSEPPTGTFRSDDANAIADMLAAEISRRGPHTAMLDLLGLPREPDGLRWERWDEHAIEIEVAELLYAYVRAAKPTHVLELGAGRSTIVIAAALEANSHGFLWSEEPERVWVGQVRRWLRDVGLSYRAQVYERDGVTEYAPDLVFIDCAHERRATTITIWAGTAAALIVHDANAYREQLEPLGGSFIPTARGLWMRGVR